MNNQDQQPDRLIYWSIFYLLLVFTITAFSEGTSTITSISLCVLTLPFYKHEERLLEVCLVLSTISYYYANGDEQILSVYTMLCLFCLIRAFTEQRKNATLFILPRAVMLVVLFLSYQQSNLSTFNGFMELVYIVVVSMIISSTIVIEQDRPLKHIHILACINIVYLVIMLAINPISDGERMQFSQDVNANTFGFASAALSLFVANDLLNKNQIWNHKFELLFCLMGILLTFLSGSRNSLLALVAAFLFLLYKQYGIANIRKYIPYVLGTAVVVLFIVPLFGLDSSRFSIDHVVASGGSNRTHIWEEMIPYVVQNNYYLGNGPGKAGSTFLLTDMVNREYNSTHNTFIESFAETGIIGLSVFVVIIISSFLSLRKKTKMTNGFISIYSMLFFVLLTSVGESFFSDVVLWIIIGLAGIKINNVEYETDY